jgi:hypothetical protein
MADVQWFVNKWGCGVKPSALVWRNDLMPYRVVGFIASTMVYEVYANKIKMAHMKAEPRTIARLAGSW